MQNERRAFGGGQPLEDHEHRHTHAVVQCDPVGRVGLCSRRLDQGLGQPRPHIGLPPRARRAEQVETQPAHHDHEPAPNVLDAIEILVQEAGERLLDDVLRFRDAPEHAVGDVEDVAAVIAPGVPESGVFS